MTNEELQEHIRAIEEAARNGDIEESYRGASFEITDDGAVLLNHINYEYRIKPKPLECWVIVDKDGDGISSYWHDEKRAMIKCANYDKERPALAPHRVVHMREVTDD